MYLSKVVKLEREERERLIDFSRRSARKIEHDVYRGLQYLWSRRWISELPDAGSGLVHGMVGVALSNYWKYVVKGNEEEYLKEVDRFHRALVERKLKRNYLPKKFM